MESPWNDHETQVEAAASEHRPYRGSVFDACKGTGIDPLIILIEQLQ